MKLSNGDEITEIHILTEDEMSLLLKEDVATPGQRVILDDDRNWHIEDKDGSIVEASLMIQAHYKKTPWEQLEAEQQDRVLPIILRWIREKLETRIDPDGTEWFRLKEKKGASSIEAP